MCLYPDNIFKDQEYVAQFIEGDEEQVAWYLDEYHCDVELEPIYDYWDKLLSICADLVKEFADQEYLGPPTNALLMDMAMETATQATRLERARAVVANHQEATRVVKNPSPFSGQTDGHTKQAGWWRHQHTNTTAP